MRKLLRDRRAVSAIEYGIITALIAVPVAASLPAVAHGVEMAIQSGYNPANDATVKLDALYDRLRGAS